MKTLNVNGIELAVVDLGSGPPVLLVHGFPLDHTMWDAQVEPLSAEHRVIAPDLRGFGRSGVTEGKVTMEQFADDLAALLDGLGVEEPVVFCGLSMGGYAAWQFWRKYSDRVRALILCDTRAAADVPEAAAARLDMANRVLAEGPEPLVDAMIPKLFADTTYANDPQAVESLRRVMLSTDPRGIAAAARGMAERPDATSMLGRIGCPTLVAVGEFDALSAPDEMQSMADAINGARFARIRVAGHMSPMENAESFTAAVLAFLGESV
ncbi:MAG: alpha/beta fold hydrolase [Planctomycetes bacterium]|nr:alpha/beta fold hydrolase [Planctomycetota bacterium]